MDILRKVFQKNRVNQEEEIIKKNDVEVKETEKSGLILFSSRPEKFLSGDILFGRKSHVEKEKNIEEGGEIEISEDDYLLGSIDDLYNEFIDTVNKDKKPADYLKCENNLKKSLLKNEHILEKHFFNYAKELLEDDSREEPDPVEIKEVKKAFVRMLADIISGDNMYEYYRKVKSLGPCNDAQWSVISHVMGMENISKIFENESVFHKEKESELKKN